MLLKFLIITIFFTSVTLSQSFYHYHKDFLNRKGKIISMDLLLVEENARVKTFDFRMKTSSDSMTGRIRIPMGSGPFRTGLLTVGIETGKDVIEMIEGPDDVILMAVDYPWTGEWNFKGWNAWSTTLKLRSMAYRTVPLLLNCLDWLFSLKETDQKEVNIVAVSFGSFTGIPAAVIDRRVKQLVVVQGGGDLSKVISQNAENWGTSLSPWFAGWIGSLLLAPFEPTLYIPHLAPRPLLMINSKGDTFFPEESAKILLESARQPKELIWHRTKHIMPGEREVIKELTNIVVKKLYGHSVSH